MTVTDTTDIAAPVDVAWRITADVERWPAGGPRNLLAAEEGAGLKRRCEQAPVPG